MTGSGKLQRIAAKDISVIGRNTQGVRIMNVDNGDQVIAAVRVPPEATEDVEAAVAALPEQPLAGQTLSDQGLPDQTLPDQAAGDADEQAGEQ